MRADSLTGLRFIAAALVFLHHVIWFNVFADQAVVDTYHAAFINAGRVGVTFFFILSGFVLTVAVRPNDTVAAFWRRRAAKIYPNHVVTALLAMVVTTVVGSSALGWELIPNLLLVQTWWPSYDVVFSVNPVSWSLACELIFYLSFPFLYPLLAKVPERALWWWVAGAAVGVVAVAAVAAAFLPASPPVPDGQPAGMYQFWFTYVFPPARLLDFVLGILMARVVLSGRWPRLRPVGAVALCVAAYAVSMSVPYLFALNAVMVLPLALLVASVAASDLAGRRSWLCSTPMLRLGECSYAFYMVHMLVMMLGTHLISGRVFSPLPAVGVLAGWFTVSLVCAWLLYTYVERPLTRLLGRGRTRRPSPGPEGGTPARPVAHNIRQR
ncbi:acyltransferase [Nocardiopsis sp. FIRDI 009]|uniref:acyltransferase family protein n=1 Tax=Nocardiopsis sp. FIRDI 009 TaxID=714197 RepID=UPI000E23FFDE|nr:acyltransferase [Nocardiopsis sp. FIRDI 009]